MKTWTHALLAAFLATAAWGAKAVDQTLPADEDVAVEIETVSGSITITGWDRPEVRVTGTVGDDTDGLDMTGGGRRVVIEVDIPDRRGRYRRDIDADLDIKVPVGARIEVETVSSGIEASGLTGRLELETVSGFLRVEGDLDSVDLTTVSGSIRFSGSARSSASAETVSGSIDLRGVSGRVEATAVSGTIEIEAGDVDRAELETVSGSVYFDGRLKRGARVDIQCHSGTVELKLPADVSARFDVSTFSGNIDNDFGPRPERTSRWVPSKELEFSVGGGDAEVSIETFSGNVRLRKK